MGLDSLNASMWGSTTDAAAYFSRWGGFEFTDPTRVTPMGMEIFTASWAGPDIAAFGDTIYVVCKENPEDMAPAYCIHSYDGGATFSEPVVVDGMLGDNISRFPSVAVNEEGQPIVAFMRLDSDFGNARYVVASSDDFGNTFNMDVLASDFSGGDVCDCCPVSITADNNYVATLYRDNLDNLRNSWAGISANGGDMFMNGIQIDQTDWMINACPSTGPDGVIIGDSLYSVFMSAATGEERIYFSASSLISLTDQPDIRLSWEILELDIENYPRIANFGKATAIVWKEVELNTNIILEFTNNVENRFSEDKYYVIPIDLEPHEPINADVSVSSTDVHVVWQDNYSDMVMYRKGSYIEPDALNEQIGNDRIKIYPNPANEIINISSDVIITSCSVSDLNNRIVLVEDAADTKYITLPLNGLNSGIYLLELTDSNGNNYFKKVIIN